MLEPSRDAGRRGKLIADSASGEVENKPAQAGRKPHTVVVKRLEEPKGGKKVKKLTADERRRIARKAVSVRWEMRERNR